VGDGGQLEPVRRAGDRRYRLAAMNALSTFTGTIGTATASLDIGITLLRSMKAGGANGKVDGGFTRFYWNPGAVAYAAEIETTGASADTGYGALRIKGGTNASTLGVSGGQVDVATVPGDTATINRIDVTGGNVTVGEGATISGSSPQVNLIDGTLDLAAAVAALAQEGGLLYTAGGGLIGAATINGEAHMNHRVSGGDSLTTLIARGNGKVFFDGDPRQILVTNNIQVYPGAMIQALYGQLKKTGPANPVFAFQQCGIGDVTLNLGTGPTVTVA
jgi:hypothetical protein